MKTKVACSQKSEVSSAAWTLIARQSDLPDMERTVLLAVPEADEPVWPGYLDIEYRADRHSEETVWRWADGSRIEHPVVAWMDLPELPAASDPVAAPEEEGRPSE